MTTATAARSLSTAAWRDYLSLAKPRGIVPHFITAACGIFLAASSLPHPTTILFTLAGGGLVAAAANVLNCYFDRDIDAIMARTRQRPLPAGRVKPMHALVLAGITGLAGLTVLNSLVNWAAAALAAITLAYYILPYTLWLKRRTLWSTIVGSGAGAIPPLIGWVAVTGQLASTPFLLSAIIVVWTLPHFWSLAIARQDDFRRAGLNVVPGRHAAGWIIFCSVCLAASTIWLALAAGLGPFYLSMAAPLGAGFVVLAVGLSHGMKAAKRLYSYSILYIIALFIVILADRLLSLL